MGGIHRVYETEGRGSARCRNDGQDKARLPPPLMEHAIVRHHPPPLPPDRLPRVGVTSNRGKFELDTSSRIRCPGMNRLLVG
jgi:hypothetical protein